jgi:hypothetical protein
VVLISGLKTLDKLGRCPFVNNWKRYSIQAAVLLVVACSLPSFGAAQDRVAILAGLELSRVVPPGFYFQGLSAPTQMRNSAAARWGSDRHVIAGLVDTSGYSADVREKYQGFLITDSDVTIDGKTLKTGAYGFGFSNDGKVNIMDLAGNQILAGSTTKDGKLRRPRPLMMSQDGERLRLYSGRDYVLIEAK